MHFVFFLDDQCDDHNWCCRPEHEAACWGKLDACAACALVSHSIFQAICVHLHNSMKRTGGVE